MTYPTGEQLVAPIGAGETCDRCIQFAQVRVVMPSHSELLLCSHHSREQAEGLRSQGAALYDRSGEEVKTRRPAFVA